jgi:hypothetical protein
MNAPMVGKSFCGLREQIASEIPQGSKGEAPNGRAMGVYRSTPELQGEQTFTRTTMRARVLVSI